MTTLSEAESTPYTPEEDAAFGALWKANPAGVYIEVYPAGWPEEDYRAMVPNHPWLSEMRWRCGACGDDHMLKAQGPSRLDLLRAAVGAIEGHDCGNPSPYEIAIKALHRR